MNATSAVDVGAAAGEFSIYFLRCNISRVLAFDPSPELAAQFSENLQLNGFDQDTRLTRLSVFLDDRTADGLKRLDDFMAELEEPVFLKIDVDGAELRVLYGAEQLLRKRRTRILLETHSQQLETECAAYLESIGFKTRVVKNAWWRMIIKDQRPIGFNRWLVASNDLSCAP